MHPVTKGDIAKWRVALALIEMGEQVLQPVSENERYDIALDRNGCLYRVQCKTGRYKSGCVIFNTCSSLAHRGGPSRDYVGQIEAFGVYCPALGKVYLVPIERVVGKRSQYLRVDAFKRRGGHGHGEATRLMAEEFELRGEVERQTTRLVSER